MPTALSAVLAAQGADELAALLVRRPDAGRGSPPTTVTELADRWSSQESLQAAVEALATPELQALEALCALGERRTLDDLTGLLAETTNDHAGAVAASVARLQQDALVWPDGAGGLAVPDALPAVFGNLLGCTDPPLRTCWNRVNADDARRALRALGERPDGRRKAELVEAVVSRLGHADDVRRLVERAPEPVRTELRRRAWAGALPDQEDDELADWWYDDLHAQQRAEIRRTADDWGIRHALLVPRSYAFEIPLMPSEVALALRGPGYRARFTPVPPPFPAGNMTPELLRVSAAGAGSAFLTRATGLLDQVARTRLPRLAGGGLGVLALGRLATSHGGQAQVRLVLELAAASELLGTAAGLGVGVTDRFTTWREESPSEQLAVLLEAWWRLPATPTDALTETGRKARALSIGPPCPACRQTRRVVLTQAAEHPAGSPAPRALADAVLWARPRVHPARQDGPAPLATVLHEGELLGVLAGNTATPVGLALAAEDPEALRRELAELLPDTTDRASFGSDLTAVVAGFPSATVTRLLDSCADRESSGGAVSWRFSAATLRRALDGGASADVLLADLAALTTRELPQPLTHLFGDVARRHGLVRVAAAVSVVCSEDEALLAEVAVDSRLGALGLRRLSPTVLACAVPPPQALEQLRSAGYLPVPEARAAPVGRQGLEPIYGHLWRPPARQPGDPLALARALLAASPLLPVPSSVAAEIRRLAPRLAIEQVQLLADAIDQGGRVQIDHESTPGSLTSRVIAAPTLTGDALIAWCELRQAQRLFALAHVRAVQPA